MRHLHSTRSQAQRKGCLYLDNHRLGTRRALQPNREDSLSQGHVVGYQHGHHRSIMAYLPAGDPDGNGETLKGGGLRVRN